MLYKVHNDKNNLRFSKDGISRVPEALHTQLDNFWSISSKQISELFTEAEHLLTCKETTLGMHTPNEASQGPSTFLVQPSDLMYVFDKAVPISSWLSHKFAVYVLTS